MHHSTRGGSKETEVKLLTVIPIWDASSEAAVITAIPVGKQPSAARKPLISKSINHLRPDPLHTRLIEGMHDGPRLGDAAKTARLKPGNFKGGGHGRRQR